MRSTAEPDRSQTETVQRRCTGDGGAAIVETALITPVVLLVVFAIFEYGIIYRDYLTSTDAAMEGAKTGSIMGPNPTTNGETADFKIMEGVRQDMSNVPFNWIDRIVIFRVDPFEGATMGNPVDVVPQLCKTGTYGPKPGQGCNVYKPFDAFKAVQTNDKAYFQCVGGTEVACGWDPANRVNGPKWNLIEYVGVYIKVDRPMLTGMFGNTFDVETAGVVRLEPGALT